MLFDAPCSDTVSIFEAVLFGAGDACIDVGLTSLLGGVALFVGCVVMLRLIGVTLLRRLLPRLRRKTATPEGPDTQPTDEGLQKLPYESPIRATGAWGAKTR